MPFFPIISHLFFFFSLSVTVEDRNPSVYRLQTKSTHFHTIYPDVNPNRYTGTIQHRAKEGNLTTHALPHRDPRRMSPPMLTKLTTCPSLSTHSHSFEQVQISPTLFRIPPYPHLPSTPLPFTVTLTALPTTLMFLDPPFPPQRALVSVSHGIMLLLSR